MDNVKKFITAALPWVIMGFSIAIIAANTAKNKKNKKEKSQFTEE